MTDDKAGIASYSASGLLAMFGALTLQQWGVIIGILGVLATLAIKGWETRQKIRIAEREAESARQADQAKKRYYHQRRTDVDGPPES